MTMTAKCECIKCSKADGPEAVVGVDHAGWICPGCMAKLDLLYAFEGMFSDGYGDVKLYTTEVVTTRKLHTCPGYWREAGHDVPAGTTAIREKALVDGKWCSCYTCESCIRDWRGECNTLRERAA